MDAAAYANTFTSLPDGVFDQLTSLTRLNLDQNKITSLPDGVFDQLTSLESLSMARIHSLSSLPADVFDQLTSLTILNLQGIKPTSLPDGIFSGLSSLTFLDLSRGRLTSLPAGIFSGLASLTELRLSGNVVDPLPLTVSLEKFGEGQFKAVAPTGAPFDIVVPVHVGNGSISGGANTLTILKGNVESASLTVTRTPGTTGAVTAHIGTLPGLPTDANPSNGYLYHQGYTLVKSDDLPLLVFTELGGGGFTPVCDRSPGMIAGLVRGYPFVPCRNLTQEELAAINGLSLAIISQLKPSDFDGLTGVTAIYIDRSSDLTIPEGVFSNLPALTGITFERCKNLTISKGAFSNLPALTYITIDWGSSGATISEGAISNLPALTNINISGNVEGVTISEGAFSNLPALTTIDLSLNYLTTLPEDIFSGLTALTTIDLSLNYLTTLPEDIFSGFTALTSLNLRSNPLTTLSEDIFNGLSSLTTLEFNYNHNEWTTLPDGIFEGLTSLTKLRMYGSTTTPLPAPLPLTISLEQVGDDQFKAVAPAGAPFEMVLPISVINGRIKEGSSSLTIPKGSVASGILTVTRNAGTTANVTVNIGTLPSLPSNHYGYSLVKSTDLPLIYPLPEVPPLMENRTQQVQDAIIAAIPGVNSASDVTEAHLAAIRFLNLQRKNITALKTGDFDGLSSLITLNLTYNDLTTLPAGVFPNLSSLRSLLLYGNDLASLPAGIFDDLSSLTELNLYNNDLTSLPAGIFDNLLKLTRLSLGSNQLTTLSMGIFDELSSLTSLYLGDGQLATVPAGVFTGLSSLTELWLHGNQLTTLSVNAFSGLSSLTRLWLQNNSTNPLSVAVSLELVDEGRFKAIAPAGAPFDFVLQISVANGTITGGATTITIPKGSVESDTLTIIRIAGTTAAVTVDIGTLPGLPTNVDPRDRPLHQGYELVKSVDLPLEVIGATAPQVTGINIPDANLRAKIEDLLSVKRQVIQ